MNERMRLAFMERKCAYRCRPDLVAACKYSSRDNVGRGVKCFVGVILRPHLLRTNGEPSRIAGKPSVALGERRIGVEVAVQRRQQIDHVVCPCARALFLAMY